MISRKIFMISSILSCSAFPVTTIAANWNPLPDTGQTACYDIDGNEMLCPEKGAPLHGQDAQYQGAAPSYTDNGNGTVTDNNTALIWQKNTADTNGDGSITSGDYPAGDQMTWQEAVDYCEGLAFGGRSDWHLPHVIELDSIIDYGNLVVNPFFIFVTGEYWTSDSPQDLPALAWYVDFRDGHNYWPSKENNFYVRCVAGAQ